MERGNRYNAIIIVLMLLALLPLAAQAREGAGAYDFLNIPTSSQSYALGGSGIAVIDDDVTLCTQNPALLGPEVDKQLAFSYMHWLGASNFASAAFGMPASERGAWAVSVRYLNFGEITSTAPDGSVLGTFSPQDIALAGTYSHDFTDRLRGGISLNAVYSNYEQYTAFALAADLGLNYYNEEKDLSLSIVMRNAGGQLKRFDKAYTQLPFDIQLGYMQGLGHSPFSLAITARHLTKWNLRSYTHDSGNLSGTGSHELKSNFVSNLFRHLVFGLQYRPTDKFYIAAGYDYKTRTDMAGYSRNFMSGISLGLGLKVKGFSIGASYGMPHKGGSTVLLNIGASLGELLY